MTKTSGTALWIGHWLGVGVHAMILNPCGILQVLDFLL
jgi:hypothetical protein